MGVSTANQDRWPSNSKASCGKRRNYSAQVQLPSESLAERGFEAPLPDVCQTVFRRVPQW
ncbi:hypothetical protein ABBQ32_003177 [Trebouxia sp. C0010 RCD-2024]